MTGRLHVANGSSTTATIQRAGIPGALSVWADPLHDGPVPGALSDDQLLVVRARHLASADHSVDETTAELMRWRRAVDDHEAYDELILWFEHDLFDQLNLIQLLDHLGPAWPTPVALICIGAYPGRPDFKGLGELTPAELAPLFETRQAVTPMQYALASKAWAAFRAPSPRHLEALLLTDTSALPFLGPALARLLEELPGTSDGLSRSERRLMEIVADAPVDLRAAFPRMHDGETAFYIADSSLLEVAGGLSEASPPLLTLNDTPGDSRTLRAVVSLTDTGRAVLEGREDRVRRCGVDRWLGGVRMSGTGPTWRWDAAGRRVVET